MAADPHERLYKDYPDAFVGKQFKHGSAAAWQRAGLAPMSAAFQQVLADDAHAMARAWGVGAACVALSLPLGLWALLIGASAASLMATGALLGVGLCRMHAGARAGAQLRMMADRLANMVRVLGTPGETRADLNAPSDAIAAAKPRHFPHGAWA